MITDGITINGKHSYTDMHLAYASHSLSSPVQWESPIEIPYRNGSVNNVQGQTFKNRTLTVTLSAMCKNAHNIEDKISIVTDWLYSVNGGDILDDTLHTYRYTKAYCTGVSTSTNGRLVTFVATFSVYPYKVCNFDPEPPFKKEML